MKCFGLLIIFQKLHLTKIGFVDPTELAICYSWYAIIILTPMYGTVRFKFIYTDWPLIVLSAAAVTVSYSLALVLAVTVEYPIGNVENTVYNGIKRRNRT